ncbi:MAG: hypothetical protein ACI4LK_09130 [Lentihominibacter sp.]
MIDERDLIKTLTEWKDAQSDVVGLKAEALLDKVIKEITNQSIKHRIKATDQINKIIEQLEEASARNAAECKKLQGEASGIDAMVHRSDLHSFATSCYDHAANIVRRCGAE